jgi:hypothetical protein
LRSDKTVDGYPKLGRDIRRFFAFFLSTFQQMQGYYLDSESHHWMLCVADTSNSVMSLCNLRVKRDGRTRSSRVVPCAAGCCMRHLWNRHHAINHSPPLETVPVRNTGRDRFSTIHMHYSHTFVPPPPLPLDRGQVACKHEQKQGK